MIVYTFRAIKTFQVTADLDLAYGVYEGLNLYTYRLINTGSFDLDGIDISKDGLKALKILLDLDLN